MKLRLLSSSDIEKAVSMKEAIEAVTRAFIAYSRGEAKVPERTAIPLSRQSMETALFMPAFMQEEEALGVKVITVLPENPLRGLPAISGLMLILSPDKGGVKAAIDAITLTALRTGAASGAASRALAVKGAEGFAVIGAGAQASYQIEAILAVRPIKEIAIYDIDGDRASMLAARMKLKYPEIDYRVAKSPEEAINKTDIITTVTTSKKPVFPGKLLNQGVHINAIGAFTPDARELDDEAISRAKIVVDSKKMALIEPGDIIIPIKKGVIKKEDILAEIGEVLGGEKKVRSSERDITLFKSVGLAVQDVMLAKLVLDRAEALGLGKEVEL
jgi:ornithine cyclodeaminase/alanine dehydrogenase-like protein (mu-crystallin family)